STDLSVVPTISFRPLYGFLILRHSHRQLLWLGATARPSAHWIARQLTEAYGWQGTAIKISPRGQRISARKEEIEMDASVMAAQLYALMAFDICSGERPRAG